MSERKSRRLHVTSTLLSSMERANPNLRFRPLVEETMEDFKRVVRERFSPGTEKQVDVLLANPLRRIFTSAGDIAYENGKPACVQGVLLRRIYYRQTPYILLNASMFAKMEDASPLSVFGVMWRTHAPRADISFWFGNTAIKASKDIEDTLVLPRRRIEGPNSWRETRVALIHPIPALWTRFRSTHPSLPAFHWKDWTFPVASYSRRLSNCRTVMRLFEITDAEFQPFWEVLLCGNTGLITSRSPEDLRWMYGSRLLSGRVVLLAIKDAKSIVGYIIVRGDDATGKRWSVVDMIAVRNDKVILSDLMREVVRYLRKKTPAMELAISGFPTWVQSTIASIFRYEVHRSHNSSSFAVYDPLSDDLLPLVDSRQGWFGGPADGDAWL